MITIGAAIAGRRRMRQLIALGILVSGFAIPVAAQTAPRAACRIVGTTVTCTSLQPVSEAQATAILTRAIPAYVPGPAPFVVPADWPPSMPIHGEVFSDRWPYEGAGVYPWLRDPVPSPGFVGARGKRLRGRSEAR
jgi:hypothetical protein